MEEYSRKEDEVWRKLCEKKYSDICHSAYKKSVRHVRWYHIFRSLTLWPDLRNARVTMKELSVCRFGHHIRNKDFQILSDGIISIVRVNDIVYYDLETFQRLPEYIVSAFEYLGYVENDDNAYIHVNNFLFVKRKQVQNRRVIAKLIKFVKLFIVIDNVLYYVTLKDRIYKCTFDDGIYTSIFLVNCDKNVFALGHDNGVLHIMTRSVGDLTYTFFSCVSNVLQTLLSNGTGGQELYIFGKYFTNHVNWTRLHYPFNFFARYRDDFPQVEHIQVIRKHGPVLCVGYQPGILCIFYSLYTTSIIDLLLSEPLKVFCLLEPHKGIVYCNILNIDVVEGVNSHTVLVAMHHKVLAIKFSYWITDEQWLHYIKKIPIYQLVSCLTSSDTESISSGSSTFNDELPTTGRKHTTRYWENSTRRRESITSTGAPSTNNGNPSTSNVELLIGSNETTTNFDKLPNYQLFINCSSSSETQSFCSASSTSNELITTCSEPTTSNREQSTDNNEPCKHVNM